MEFVVAGIIIAVAIYIFYKNIKRKSSGSCDCGSCSHHCPQYKDKK